MRLWDGGEAYANPEIDQGFGLSNTLGVAGFPSGEAYKVGKSDALFPAAAPVLPPDFRSGRRMKTVDADANQLGGTHTANNLVLTGGKISATDIFDTNSYAHDPRGDFLNWALIDCGRVRLCRRCLGLHAMALCGEWTQDWWTLRGGLFDLSRVPNHRAGARLRPV